VPPLGIGIEGLIAAIAPYPDITKVLNPNG
jgi:hypothetical protein